MIRVRLPFGISGVVLCLLLCAACTNAALVKTDLIGGLGEFELSADTSWQMETDGAWPWGRKPSTPDFSVASGWWGVTGYGLDPGEDVIFRIEPGKGIKGSSCQYLALKRTSAAVTRILIQLALPINDDRPSDLHHGDTVTFRIDRMFMTGYTVPGGAWVKYCMMIVNPIPGQPTSVASNYVTPSATPFAAEVSSTLAPGSPSVTLEIQIFASGNIGSAVPGMYIDGARLYVKRAGSSSYATEQVPAPRNRSVNTQMVFFTAHDYDAYAVARDYDTVMLQYESDYYYALRLKYYNPNIKVLLYEHSGAVSDFRDQYYVDPAYSNCPFAFSTVLAEHLEWLYPWPADYVPLEDDRSPWKRNVSFCFMPDYQYLYYVHMDNPDYQQEWLTAVIDKVTRYQLDGVFVDGAESVATESGPVVRTPAEVQCFEHSVYPYLKQAGIPIVMNCAIGVLRRPPADLYFDPSWRTDASYSPSQGYENNTPYNTPDTFFQEWAFLKRWAINGVMQNVYNIDYWNDTMGSMEKVAVWNRTLPKRLKKSMFALTDGVDRPGDPAAGLDGWAHFGLCSFLLAQHQDAWFGAQYVETSQGPVDVDMSVTTRLGAAASGRGMLASDKSLQMRLYKNGLVIVNGHPSAHRSYRIFMRVIDEDGTLYPKGLTIDLKPHTGRIFFYK
jgi:hypothetical protein